MNRWRRLGGLILACAGGIIASVPTRADDPPPAQADARMQAERLLEARGLRRSGTKFVLPAEEAVRSTVGSLETLVTQNQEAVRRRQLRGSIESQSHSMFLGLQSQRLALDATIANNPIPDINAPGMPRGLTAAEARSAQFGQILDETDVQLRNITNVVAGVAADNESDAAEALARQDEFAQSSAGLERPAAAIARRYEALRADPEVASALATLAQAEGQPVTLGPLDDYPARLQALRAAMEATRVLTVLPGRSAPNYTIASLLADSTRRDLRRALGQLEAWNQRAAADPNRADPNERAAIEARLAALRPRFVRSVALVRQAYDDLRARPLANTAPPPAQPAGNTGNANDMARLRSLVEEQRAGLRATFVAELERALRVTRVPLEARADGYGIPVSLNGGPKTPLRLDLRSDLMRLPEGLAAQAGVVAGATAPWELVALPDGSSVRARRATVASVRIGSFEVDRVGCLIVAGDDATPVLGASALRSFVTRIDTASEPPALALTRIDLKPILPRPLPANAPPPKVRTRNSGR